ncbi:MAG: PepSY-associated TM helix domain-containing protein, partial [Phycisphaerae bacterium]
LLGLLADLNKGESAGDGWKWIIDTAAGGLFLASISGLLLLLAFPKRRRLGLMAIATGVAGCVLGYLVLVP